MITPETTCLCCFRELHEPRGVCPYCGCNNATISNEAHHLEAGSILAGTYLIGKVLGQGGFGITYVGWDLNLEIKVAIKEYYPEGCVTRDTHTHVSVLTYAGPKDAFFQKGKERFVGEARALAKFSGDSGVVGVRAFFFENGTAYIVMDFVDGETLKAYAARVGGRLPSAQVLALFQPLIRSLARVHESGLLHRDISPDNIMLKPDGTLALLDFGAARQISVAGEHSNTINVKHGFAPEEQYRTRGEQGPWTDVYALCATIYRLTTGVTPTEALDRMANDEQLSPPSAYGADFSPEQEAAVMHGLALRANARTRDLQQLTEELYAVSEPAQSPMAAPIPASVQEQAPQEEPQRGQATAQSISTPFEGKQKNAALVKKENKRLLIFGILAAVIMVFLFVFAYRNSSVAEMPGATEEPQMTQEPVTEYSNAGLRSTTVVNFKDKLFEEGIRKVLNMTNGETITVGDLEYIRSLNIAGDHFFINDESIYTYADLDSKKYTIDTGDTWYSFPEYTMSLSDLKYFINLENLEVTAVTVLDLDSLRVCSRLSSVSLGACGDVDLSDFEGFVELTKVSVGSCSTVSLSGLASNLTFTDLGIDSCKQLPTNIIVTLKSLTELQLLNNGITDLQFLERMTQLTSLSISGPEIQNIAPIASLTNLQYLLLMSMSITDISALSNLTALNTISFISVPVSDISALAQMKNLSSFDCAGTNITDFSPLAGLPLQWIGVDKQYEDTLKQMFPSAQVYGY